MTVRVKPVNIISLLWEPIVQIGKLRTEGRVRRNRGSLAQAPLPHCGKSWGGADPPKQQAHPTWLSVLGRQTKGTMCSPSPEGTAMAAAHEMLLQCRPVTTDVLKALGQASQKKTGIPRVHPQGSESQGQRQARGCRQQARNLSQGNATDCFKYL